MLTIKPTKNFFFLDNGISFDSRSLEAMSIKELKNGASVLFIETRRTTEEALQAYEFMAKRCPVPQAYFNLSENPSKEEIGEALNRIRTKSGLIYVFALGDQAQAELLEAIADQVSTDPELTNLFIAINATQIPSESKLLDESTCKSLLDKNIFTGIRGEVKEVCKECQSHPYFDVYSLEKRGAIY